MTILLLPRIEQKQCAHNPCTMRERSCDTENSGSDSSAQRSGSDRSLNGYNGNARYRQPCNGLRTGRRLREGRSVPRQRSACQLEPLFSSQLAPGFSSAKRKAVSKLRATLSSRNSDSTAPAVPPWVWPCRGGRVCSCRPPAIARPGHCPRDSSINRA